MSLAPHKSAVKEPMRVESADGIGRPKRADGTIVINERKETIEVFQDERPIYRLRVSDETLIALNAGGSNVFSQQVEQHPAAAVFMRGLETAMAGVLAASQRLGRVFSDSP